MTEISKPFALSIHEASVDRYGGATGIRDDDGLEAALARPFATFGGELLYPEAIERAAAIAESIIMNHPFVDGNKRTGFALMIGIMMDAGLTLSTSEDENYQFVIDLATGEKRFGEAVEWLREHSVKR